VSRAISLLTAVQGLPDKVKALQVRFDIAAYFAEIVLNIYQAANDRLIFEKAELVREKQVSALHSRCNRLCTVFAKLFPVTACRSWKRRGWALSPSCKSRWTL
jgi:hypothetical protein